LVYDLVVRGGDLVVAYPVVIGTSGGAGGTYTSGGAGGTYTSGGAVGITTTGDVVIYGGLVVVMVVVMFVKNKKYRQGSAKQRPRGRRQMMQTFGPFLGMRTCPKSPAPWPTYL
jgi:hypothetical protein